MAGVRRTPGILHLWGSSREFGAAMSFLALRRWWLTTLSSPCRPHAWRNVCKRQACAYLWLLLRGRLVLRLVSLAVSARTPGGPCIV